MSGLCRVRRRRLAAVDIALLLSTAAHRECGLGVFGLFLKFWQSRAAGTAVTGELDVSGPGGKQVATFVLP